MTSDSAEKPVPGSSRMERITNSLVYANRRFHNNKLSCFLVTLVFVLVGCFVMIPPMVRETSSQMLNSYRGSSAELIARIREVVAAGNGANLEKEVMRQLLPLESEVEVQRKGKGGKKKGKKGKGKMKEDFIGDQDDEDEKGADEVYGSISSKINKKGKTNIRNNFTMKENNGMNVWEENSEEDDEQKDKLQKGNNAGRKYLRDNNIYIEDVRFKLSENWTEADTEQERQVMAERAATVRSVCKDLQQQEDYTEFPQTRLLVKQIWVTEPQMVWCPIFKAASTTWMKNLMELAHGPMMERKFHAKTRKIYPMPEDPEEVESILEKAMKLIIVRHPLDRILSAYRDKMRRTLNDGTLDNYKEMQQNIAKKFPDPELPEGADDAVIRPESDEMPTFNQFLMSVKEDVQTYWNIKGKYRINLHWRPYWATCSPCAFQYNTIAKVETLPKDQEFIIRDRGLEETVLYAQTHSSNFDSFNSTREATIAYFSRVPRSLLKEIVSLYQPDFDLFDYSPNYHLSLSIKGI